MIMEVPRWNRENYGRNQPGESTNILPKSFSKNQGSYPQTLGFYEIF
jgi:hypothetical protein